MRAQRRGLGAFRIVQREKADPQNQKDTKGENEGKKFNQHDILASISTSKVDVHKKRNHGHV